ncbi:TPA: hypothetical protein DDZ86_00455 [Candidatus Dependentiae bacterium]|nr:MAG: hypothetical protein UW09_C0002G0032 [candidate division TM6 bacterium GW2011_GWF2_43_87]HBL98100.1 hypothetical protein [Candidatus Dependentiae bacterium]
MNDRFYAQSYEGVQSFLTRVFGWMAFALTLTGVTSLYVASSPSVRNVVLGKPWVFLLLIIAELGLAIGLSAAITSISYTTAFMMFGLYSVLTGMTLSVIFLVYTMPSIAMTFFVAASMFAFMAIYGMVTKADLTSMGSFLRMALWGIIVALLLNMFFKSAAFDLVLAIIGVVVFAGLTAYDIQKIKEFAQRADVSNEMASNIALLGALQLYLDFINLFLNLLRIMGNRKE